VRPAGRRFNGHYLTWADEAATALLAAQGTPYADLLARGLDMSLVRSELVWSAPARYGDVVEVDAAVERIGGSSWTTVLAISAGDRPCCTVRTTYVLHGPDRRPLRVPEDLRSAWAPQHPE
jgi:acyl-CoA thioester hydrolase